MLLSDRLPKSFVFCQFLIENRDPAVRSFSSKSHCLFDDALCAIGVCLSDAASLPLRLENDALAVANG